MRDPMVPIPMDELGDALVEIGADLLSTLVNESVEPDVLIRLNKEPGNIYYVQGMFKVAGLKGAASLYMAFGVGDQRAMREGDDE